MTSGACGSELSISAQPAPPPASRPAAEKHSYGEILKSSALIGGSSMFNIGIGMVRTKSMALLLGPAGFGLTGLYLSVSNLAQSVAGFGVNSSGVRQIAEAFGSGNSDRIARTAAVLRRVSLVLGALGAALLIVFSKQVSILTFGNAKNAGAICLLSLAVFFTLVSNGQGALIQGMRRISDLARMGVLGASLGVILTIVLVYFLRERGIVLSLVGVALMSLVISWFYSRKLHVRSPFMTLSEIGHEASPLLKLGFAFMASSLVTLGSAYAVRIIILHKIGLQATGLYQSAWTLGGLYVGFILQAMGADFYPRLTASANDNLMCNRLVNEQTRVGLLLAGPGVIATMVFAPLVVALLYSAKFAAAVGILRWVCLGVMLQVISWPMGYIIVAKNDRIVFLVSDLLWAVVHVGLAWVSVRHFGLDGAGMAFFGSYVFHAFLTYAIVRHRSGFRWSSENRKTGLFFLFSIALVFFTFHVLPAFGAECIGGLAFMGTGVYSARTVLSLISLDRIPRPMLRLLVWSRICPTGPLGIEAS